MTGIAAAKRPSLASALRAEALKFKHAAPMRLAIALALPMPLLGAWPSASTGEQVFSAWNYWYALSSPSCSRSSRRASRTPTRG